MTASVKVKATIRVELPEPLKEIWVIEWLDNQAIRVVANDDVIVYNTYGCMDSVVTEAVAVLAGKLIGSVNAWILLRRFKKEGENACR